MKPVALALLVLVAACSSGRDSVAAPSTLSVRQAYDTSKGMYVEGAVAELVLVHDGVVLRTERSGPTETVSFGDLEAGTYELWPGLLPCDANCGTLDARTDTCGVQPALPATTSVEVTYTPTASCVATTG